MALARLCVIKVFLNVDFDKPGHVCSQTTYFSEGCVTALAGPESMAYVPELGLKIRFYQQFQGGLYDLVNCARHGKRPRAPIGCRDPYSFGGPRLVGLIFQLFGEFPKAFLCYVCFCSTINPWGYNSF